MRLCHPPYGSTSPKYKLLCFKTAKKIWKEKITAFKRERCCHIVLCLRLIPFHYLVVIIVLLLLIIVIIWIFSNKLDLNQETSFYYMSYLMWYLIRVIMMGYLFWYILGPFKHPLCNFSLWTLLLPSINHKCLWLSLKTTE